MVYMSNLALDLEQIFSKAASSISSKPVSKLEKQLESLIDRPNVDILEWIESDKYLNQQDIFSRSKWLLDIVLNPKRHLDLFESYGYEKPPDDGFDEIILVLGMKSAKTNMTAILLCYKLYQLLCDMNPQKTYGFISTQDIFFRNFATSQRQGQDTVFSRAKGMIDRSPWFQRYIKVLDDLNLYDDRTTEVEFKHTRIIFRSMHTRLGGIVGITSFFEACDEIAKFHSETGAYNGDNIWEASQSVTKPFNGSAIKVALSSPEYEGDCIFRLAKQSGYYIYSKEIEKKDPLFKTEEEIEKVERRIAFRFPTWEMNPTLSFESFKSEFITDENRAMKNFGTIFGQRSEAFFKNIWKLESMFQNDMEYPLTEDDQCKEWFRGHEGIKYYIAGDPGQGRPCRFGLALGYLDKRQFVDKLGNTILAPYANIIFIKGFEPNPETQEVDFIEVQEFILLLCDLFHVEKVFFDNWQNILLRQQLQRDRIDVEDHTVNYDDYTELKNMVNDGRIACVKYQLALDELKRVQEYKGRKIIAGDSFTKDVADCIASLAKNMSESETTQKKRHRVKPQLVRGLYQV